MAKTDWSAFTPVDPQPEGAVDWGSFTPVPAEKDQPGLLARAKQGLESTVGNIKIAATDDPRAIAQTIAESEKTRLPQTAAQIKMAQEIKPLQDEYQQAQGLDAVGAFAKIAAKRLAQFVTNPTELAGAVLENLPNSAPGLAGGAAGATAGSAAGPVGTVVGGVAGGTAGGYAVEQGAAMRDQVLKEAAERGIDARDARALEPLIREKYDEFLQKSRLKGIGTAGTDAVLNAVTFGLAGAGERAIARGITETTQAARAGTIGAEQAAKQLAELEARQAARTTLGARAARGTAVTGAEMAGEGLSEAAGQKLAYGQVDALDVIDESILGLGQGVGMSASRGLINRAMGQPSDGGIAQALGSAKEELSRQRQAAAEQQLQSAPDASSAAAAANELAGSVDELTSAVDEYLRSAPPAPVEPGTDNSIPALRARADREAELLAQADQAGTEFDRNMALEQLQVARPEPAPRTTDQFVDLAPMDQRQADLRLAVLRDEVANEGGNALELAVVPHPSQEGKFAIGKASLPSLDLETAAPAPVAPAQAQARLESAAMAGREQARRAEDAPRQDMISRTMANIEARGGVASPYEAELLRAANMGQPFNRIDPNLGRPASTDEKLTAATGIAVGQEAGLGFGARESTRQAPAPAPFEYSPELQGQKRQEAPTPAPAPSLEQTFVQQMRETNTPAARAFVQAYEAGRITDADVTQALETQRQLPASAQQRIEGAAAQAQPTQAQGLQVEQLRSRGVSPVLAEAVSLFGNKPLTAQDLTVEGATSRIERAATQAPAPQTGGLQIETPYDNRAGFRGRNEAIRVGNNLPRPARVGGVVASTLTDEQLRETAGNTALPAITRRGAQIELLAREQEQRGSTPAPVATPDVQGRLEAAAAEGSRLSQPSGGRIILASNAQLSTQRQPVPGATVAVKDGSTEHQVRVVDPSRLGGTGRFLTQVARVFGKRLVAFESDTLQADGFVMDNDGQSIFVNTKSQISPLAVFGHELTHLLKRDNPQAYEALQAVVERELGEGALNQFEQEYGAGANLEELTSDLVGNRFQEADFWTAVFDEVAAQNPEGARGVITRLAAAITKAVNAFLKLARQPGFQADAYVKDVTAVKAAVTKALAQYAQSQRATAMQMEAEVANAQVDLASQSQPADVTLSPARRGGVAEDVGEFKVRTQKDGTLGVAGEVERIRSMLPEDVKGRAVPGGMVFTTADAPRVRAALEGRKLAYSRAGQVVDKLPTKNGKYLGAPEKFNTPAKIPTLRKMLRNLTLEGERGRFWYENSSREVLAMVGGNVQEARKFVALLAIYSPQAKVDTNSTFALRAWAQYKAGQPISVKTAVMDNKAQAALDDVDAFWSGEKTGNFFNNLLREIDPSTAGKQGATIDMWMMRAGQYDNDAPTATQYAFMENETNRLAQELGWEPQQVQAAIWVAMKARMENPGVKKRTEASSEKKGWIRFDYPLKNGRPVKTRVILNAQAHRDNWLKHAFEHTPTKEDTAQAKFDFADGLRRHIGQLSWEARPGRSTGVLPGVNDAPYEQQVEFQQAVQKALLDDNGVDLLAYKLGLLVDGPDILAPGVWQGEVAAGMQKLVAMAPSKGDEAKGIDSAQKKALDAYAAMLGLLTHQEGVGYHRPFYNTTMRAANGVNLDLGRPLQPDEAKALWGAIDQRMRDAGVQNWENGAGMISAPTGMRVVNLGAMEDNGKFRALIKEAAATLPVDQVDVGAFASDGDLVVNDWKESPNGENYRSRIAAAGAPDLLEWGRDVLAPRVQSVFNEFSSRYGWGDPGSIKLSRQRDGDRAGRDQGRGLAPLAGAPAVEGAAGPDPRLVQVAEGYARSIGLDLKRQAEYVAVDPARAARIADAYAAMPHEPQNPRVRAAYQDLIRQTIDQYRALEDAGYRFYFFDESNDPYQGNPWNAMRDLRATQSMGVFATEAGFGGTASELNVEDNPLLADTGIEWPWGSLDGQPKRVLANDLFRAVHDAFGHGLEGAGFRAQGEENAWQAHVRLFTGDAVGAITSETRGQNSWLNYGPYGEQNRTAKVEGTEFATQKTGLMPEWTWTEGRVGDAQLSPVREFPRITDFNGLKLRKSSADIRVSAASAFADEPFTIQPGVREIPLSEVELQDTEFLRSAPEQRRIEDLAAAIKRNGAIEPLFVAQRADGSRYVAEGQHRVRALMSLGYNSIPARVMVESGTGDAQLSRQRAPITVTAKGKDWFEAKAGAKTVGKLAVWRDNRDKLVAMNVAVSEKYRRQGVARKMYEAAEAANGEQLYPAISLSDDAFEFWKRFRPESVAQDLRQWKDQVIGARAVWKDKPGTIIRASGRTATIEYDTPFDNGATQSTIMREELPGAIEAAGGQPIDFSPRTDITASRRRNLGQLTHAQETALRNVGGIQVDQTARQRMAELGKKFAATWAGGIFDQFAELSKLDTKAYILARMSRAGEGALEALMLYGKPFLKNDVMDVNVGDEGFAKVLGRLEGEQDRFLWWVAAQRAERLKAQGLENLFTDQDITELKALNQGAMASGAPRAQAYARALQEMNDFGDAVLKVAEESGLIDPAARQLFKDTPYVPFYRVMDQEGGVAGPTFSSGLTNQYAWKKLKGGTQKLNNDLLANVLMNWSHLYTAAAKNRAAVAALQAAEAAGVASPVPAGTKGAVRVRVGGKEQSYLVDDGGVMAAISAIEYKTPGFFKPFSTMKRWLSIGVTANPAYKVKNLIRDSVAAPAVSSLSGNVAGNVATGLKATAKDSQSFASLIAGGGVIRFGSMLDGAAADRTRTLVRKEGGVLLDEKGWKKLTGQLGDLWDAYNEVGDRFENVNRAALYEQLIAKGYSQLEANFMARDLMDFSMQGRWPVVRFLVETVPFLNARLQGLYKLGRGAKENPRKFGAVVGAVALASLALLLAYQDDEDWKKRPDWDRDTNWWFKIGGTAFRIPKPFEVGAIGTLAERGWELAFNKDMTMRRFGDTLSRMIFSTFALDPTPQVAKPLLDIYSNKAQFSGRPIEGLAMQRLRPEDRFDDTTSYAARFLGQLGLPNPAGLARGEYAKLSPVQIDYLLRGYFGWLGTAATTVMDFGLRPVLGQGERPDMRLRDVFFAGNFAEELPSNSSRYIDQLYAQAKEIEQAYQSHRDALKRGDRSAAQELMRDEGAKIRAYDRVKDARDTLSELNAKIKQIEASKTLSGESKRKMIDQLKARQSKIAERAVARLPA